MSGGTVTSRIQPSWALALLLRNGSSYFTLPIEHVPF